MGFIPFFSWLRRAGYYPRERRPERRPRRQLKEFRREERLRAELMLAGPLWATQMKGRSMLKGLWWRQILPDRSAAALMLRRTLDGEVVWVPVRMVPLEAPYWPGPVGVTRVGWFAVVVDCLSGLTVAIGPSVRLAREAFHAKFVSLSREEAAEWRETLDQVSALLAPPRPRIVRVGDTVWEGNTSSGAAKALDEESIQGDEATGISETEGERDQSEG